MVKPRDKRRWKQVQAAQARADSGNDLNAASRAQLGPDEEKRPYRPPQYDASIEDPLQDWPDDLNG